MRTRDRLSSLACQFSCPEYLLSQYDPNTTKSDYELIARFWLKFAYNLLIYSSKREDLVVLKIFFFKFFLWERAKLKSLSFFGSLFSVSIKTLSLFFSLFLLFVFLCLFHVSS